MEILIFKTIHIVGFTSWFAGLFYLVRMFVYHTEAYDQQEPDRTILKDRYHLMEERVYKIICNPALILTWISGLIMIYLYGWEWLKINGWLHIKLLFVFFLTIYHLYCKKLIYKLKKRKTAFTSFQFRLFNEVPALILIAVVIFAVFKNTVNAVTAFLILLATALLFYIFARAYKAFRAKK